MGGLISNFRSKESDEEEKIKNYQQTYEENPYGFAFADDEDLQKVKWWQYLVYDMRFRIGYALLIGIILGIIVPVIIYVAWFDSEDSSIYGSCMIKEEARFQCLVNGAEPATRKDCIDALCCWNSTQGVQYNCHYTFPSAFQYEVSGIRESYPNQSDPTAARIELFAVANHPERMNNLSLLMNWKSEEHLSVQIFNPNDYPGRVSSTPNENIRQYLGTTQESSKGNLILKYGQENGYLFFRIGRNDSSQETLIDTRLGPLNSGRNFISFTTTLPTPFFYGLKGGEGIDSKGSVTYGVVNGFENAEVPFYMSLEESGSWHGVLLDTKLPFVTQVVQAPAIMFHVQGPAADINLHVFPGPTPEDVFRQFHAYLSEKLEEEIISFSPYIPPYWGLGLHLCRKSDNASVILKHLEELNELHSEGGNNRMSSTIIYDSDCIDEDLRSPFGINSEKFPESSAGEIEQIFDFLQNNATKKILLTQKLAMPWNASEWESESPILKMLVQNKTDSANPDPFVGYVDGRSVVYPDVFHPEIFKNLSIWEIDFESMPFDGIVFTDNFPKNEKARESCGRYNSFLDRFLFNGTTYTDPYQNLTWGSVCPNMVHTVYNGVSESNIDISHLEVHNVYGQQAVKKFLELAIKEENQTNLVISSSSMWTEGLSYGGRNGMEVTFSWVGLRESLAHYLQNFITSPFSGTPICGSFLPNDTRVFDAELCLRWYQVGLLLPFAYHSYGHSNSSRGPLDFPDGYQRYLNEAVRQRYTYAPYYYTLVLTYEETLVPPVTPMSFLIKNSPTLSFNQRRTLFNLVDQFMIGDGLLAAPIVKPSLNRETYFPPGIWYDVDGFVAWDDTVSGGNKTVTGHIHQTPLFVRGGHIIPTLQNPQGNTILESRQGSNNFTLLVALISNDVSHGILYNDNERGQTDKFSFKATNNGLDNQSIYINITIKLDNTPNCGEIFTTTINHLKLLGFPSTYRNVTVPDYPDGEFFLGDDVNTLRVDGLNINWCNIQEEKLIVISATK